MLFYSDLSWQRNKNNQQQHELAKKCLEVINNLLTVQIEFHVLNIKLCTVTDTEC